MKMAPRQRCVLLVVVFVVWAPVTALLRPTTRLRCEVRGGASAMLQVEEVSPSVVSARALKEEADAAQRRGDFEAALRSYGEALGALAEEGTTSAQAALVAAGCHVNAARCRSKLADHDAAVRRCSEAIAALDDEFSSNVYDTTFPAARSLRSVALYRRATAYDALGDQTRALDDASVAAALGEARAEPLAQRLREEAFKRHRAQMLTTPTQTQPVGHLADAATKLLADPKKLAGLLPLAKQLATTDGLRNMGFEPKRAEHIASFVQDLQPDGVERWSKRLSTAIKIWRRSYRAVSTAWRIRTHAIYGLVFSWMAMDSLALFRSS